MQSLVCDSVDVYDSTVKKNDVALSVAVFGQKIATETVTNATAVALTTDNTLTTTTVATMIAEQVKKANASLMAQVSHLSAKLAKKSNGTVAPVPVKNNVSANNKKPRNVQERAEGQVNEHTKPPNDHSKRLPNRKRKPVTTGPAQFKQKSDKTNSHKNRKRYFVFEFIRYVNILQVCTYIFQ